VEHAVPLIYTRDALPPAMTPWSRLLALAISVTGLTLLGIGAWLIPNGERGISTHTQLGLPPCAWEERMGIPCPSCGYTTSVSYFAHGNLIASLYIQPMGFVIAAFFAAAAWIGAYIAFTGRPVHRLVSMLPGRMLLVLLLALAIAGWAWKIAIHLTGHDHWPI